MVFGRTADGEPTQPWAPRGLRGCNERQPLGEARSWPADVAQGSRHLHGKTLADHSLLIIIYYILLVLARRALLLLTETLLQADGGSSMSENPERDHSKDEQQLREWARCDAEPRRASRCHHRAAPPPRRRRRLRCLPPRAARRRLPPATSRIYPRRA